MASSRGFVVRFRGFRNLKTRCTRYRVANRLQLEYYTSSCILLPSNSARAYGRIFWHYSYPKYPSESHLLKSPFIPCPQSQTSREPAPSFQLCTCPWQHLNLSLHTRNVLTDRLWLNR
jgi:hypothetical protein